MSWRSEAGTVALVCALVASPLVSLVAGEASSDEAKARLQEAIRLQGEGRYEDAAEQYAVLAVGAEARGDRDAQARAAFLHALCLKEAGRYQRSLDRLTEFLESFPGHARAVPARMLIEELGVHRSTGFVGLEARAAAYDHFVRRDFVAARQVIVEAIEKGVPPDSRSDLEFLAARCSLLQGRHGVAEVEFRAVAEGLDEARQLEAIELADLAHSYVMRQTLAYAGAIMSLLLLPLPLLLLPRGAWRGGAWWSMVRPACLGWLALLLTGVVVGPLVGTHLDQEVPLDQGDVLRLLAFLAPAVLATALLGQALARRGVSVLPGALVIKAYALATVSSGLVVFLWIYDLFPALGLSHPAGSH